MTVTGVFEPASLDVPHLEAGAGNILLVARLILAVLALILFVALSFAAPQGRAARWHFVLAGISTIPVFL